MLMDTTHAYTSIHHEGSFPRSYTNSTKNNIKTAILVTPDWPMQYWYPMVVTTSKGDSLRLPSAPTTSMTAWRLFNNTGQPNSKSRTPRIPIRSMAIVYERNVWWCMEVMGQLVFGPRQRAQPTNIKHQWHCCISNEDAKSGGFHKAHEYNMVGIGIHIQGHWSNAGRYCQASNHKIVTWYFAC